MSKLMKNEQKIEKFTIKCECKNEIVNYLKQELEIVDNNIKFVKGIPYENEAHKAFLEFHIAMII